ncbi:SDR family NAD(P)-dependent oxidoreductase [Amycolatopsis samaneae]|uniref:SDR family NAD(P)-dependent oxidoreductase n=1 Tax=Amycolatopsis samaneae TaxID=664691 RepID=A0ABW5GWX5_9PSEU
MTSGADPGTVRQRLRAIVAAEQGVPAEDVDTGSSFHDLGLSSSQLISACGEFEDWLGSPVPASMLYQYPTIDALTAALTGPAVSPTPAPVSAAPQGDPVCVVGLGCRFPGGANGPDRFWRALVARTDAATEVPADRWDAAAYFDRDPTAPGKSYTTRGGFLDDLAGFDADFFGIPPAEAVRMDPQHRLLLEVTWSALEHAGVAPDRLRGSRTGVFVGMMGSQEYARVQTDREADACFDDPYFGYGTAPSVAAGRLSYLLDLRGPSLCLDTACSSSLLGVHLAAQSLARGECDLAVAGGVSALPHPAALVQACRAHMLAADGRCKTFDAAADGFLMSEGCGVVVLERLGDAVARGHRVLAVLRGSSAGQDGRSNGMTAPNLAAQVQVIRDAQAAAGVRPSEVGYLETHGSGTRLGDAIEVSALREVFGADRDAVAPLVLGAVKSNLGHLLGAAGIAGFIKAVLVLRHGEIPANLHLTEPSPDIDWARSPVSLPDRLTAWPATGGPRIAGVSSFGWSGTNVHVVLEEGPAPGAPSPEAGGGWRLLMLSGHTETAVSRVAAGLREELTRRGEEVDLADVAYTLREGRAELSHRLSVVCRDVPEAVRALGSVSGPIPRVRAEGDRGAGFLFPGTGDHAVGMGRGLYDTEKVFRATFDECADLLRPELDADLRDLVYPADASGAAVTGLAGLLGRAPAARDRSLHRVDVVHSAVFTVEYALAKLWQSRGVEPAALLGYSLGEYVAACLAGVFSLPDALSVVARRGRLIGGLPGGVMLAVPLPAAELTGLLPAGVSVAAYNGPAMAVVAGPPEPVRRLENLLDGRDVVHRRVNNGHALHTGALAPVRAGLVELIGEVSRGAPEIPVISSRSGDWLTAEEAADPGYWAAQMCEPVRFDRGLRTFAERAGIALETGPGQTLSSLAGQRADGDGRGVTAIPTLRPGWIEGDDHEYLTRAAGRYWAAGGRTARERETGRRILALPTYPFEHRRFWPDRVHNVQLHNGQSGGVRSHYGLEAPDKREDRADWCHVPVWKQSFPILRDAMGEKDRWLVLTPGPALDEIVTALGAGTAGVVTVAPGEGFRQRSADSYVVAPDGYRQLVERLRDTDRLPTHVLYAWPDGDNLVYHVLRNLLGALGGHAAGIGVRVLSVDAQDVLPGEAADPRMATAHGFTGTLEQEFPGIGYRVIDVASADLAAAKPANRARLVAELRSGATDPCVAYRGGVRWVRGWDPVRIEPAGPGAVWREDGVYLITGGFGELGRALARGLAARGGTRLALLGRSAPEPEVVRELEELGAEVLPLPADVADPAQLADALGRIRARFGALHGVIHAAGVPAGGLVTVGGREDAERVLRPKVDGTLALCEALAGQPLDFLVLYSSSVVAFGGLGESDYSAANNFLGAFARAQRARGLPVTAIDWGPWQRDAWTPAGAGTWARLRELRDRYGITDEEGIDLLTRVLATPLAQVMVVPQDPDLLAARWRELATVPGGAARAHPRPPLRTPYVAPRTEVERTIAKVWQRCLGVDRVGVDDQLFELGGTSLIGLTIVAALAKELAVPLSAADLFEAPTPAALAGVVANRLGGGETGPAAPRGERGARRRELAEAAARRGRRTKGRTR